MAKEMRCIICGKTFPAAIVTCPVKDGEPKRFPKEICDSCVGDPKKPIPAIPRHYQGAPLHGYLMLAGTIECGVLRIYAHSYEDALDAYRKMETDIVCSEEEIKFIHLHRSLVNSAYHSALTLGNIDNLLESARLSHGKDMLPRIETRYGMYIKMRKGFADAKTFKEATND